MSTTKSKSTKRREQRKNSHASSHGSGNSIGAKNADKSNKQQKAISELKKAFDAQSIMVRQQQKAILALAPKADGVDIKSTIDEKYVKVPDATELALKQLNESVGAINTSSWRADDKSENVQAIRKELTRTKELIGTLKDLNFKADLSVMPSGNLKLLKQLGALKQLGLAHFTVGHPNIAVQMDGSIKIKKYDRNMCWEGILTSAANTAYTTALALIPGTSAEFASMQSLFDEYMADSMKFHFRVYSDGAVANTSQTNGILVYDPIDNSTYTSISGAMIASQHFGPFYVGGASNSAQVAVARNWLPTGTHTGFWMFEAKMPKGPQVAASVNVEILTGNWSSSTDSGAIYGYVKPYMQAAGAGITTTIQYFMSLHTKFRSET